VPFWEQLEGRLRAIPGVVSVAGAGTFPLNDRGPFSQPIQIDGRELPADTPRPQVNIRVITPEYFRTLGQPLLAGRPFLPSDRGRDTPVAIVNRTMAEHYWPGETAVGRRLSGNNGRTWTTVVGVAADTRQQLNEPPEDELYVCMFQGGQLSTNWLVRSTTDPSTLVTQVRDAVYSIDAQQPVDNFRTLAEVRAVSLRPPTLTATLLALFAALALVITSAGIAGVIAFSVNQRTQEFGVRMALGAQRLDVLGMVLRQGLRLVLTGLALGVAGALLLTRLIATLLYEVEPTDALTFLAVSAVLVVVAVFACLLPARRAASVDPIVALRVN
jgi:predicted permease